MSRQAQSITQLLTAVAVFLVALIVPAQAIQISYGPLAAPDDPTGYSPPTSATVYWRTDQATSSNTAYVSPYATGPWTFTGTDSNVSDRHEVYISGLSPESRYYVYVESDGVTSDVVEFRTGINCLVNGSLETWHDVYNEDWGAEEPDAWFGWEIYPWDPDSTGYANHITIEMDRMTGVPDPLSKHLDHQAGMDEGWRTCYGGLFQQIMYLDPGTYVVSGWVAWLFDGVGNYDAHNFEIIAKDGVHESGVAPTGTVIWEQHPPESDLYWKYVQGTVECTTGYLTVYLNLRSDGSDGKSFVHFDGIRVMAANQSDIGFQNFESTYLYDGTDYDITIEYDTLIPSTTQIEWGATTGYGYTTPLDSNLVEHHVVVLNDVSPAAVPYHFRALATAPGDISEYSGDRTFDAPDIVISNVGSWVDQSLGTVCTVSWDTNYETSENYVYYKEVGAPSYEVAQAMGDPQPHTHHAAVITDLELDTMYQYHVASTGPGLPTATTTTDKTFQTPSEPGPELHFSFAMVGGSILHGGDDVGPGDDWEDLMVQEHPYFNLMGLGFSSWTSCEPNAPVSGVHTYDWSSVDAFIANAVPGKSKRGYYQMWGTSPGWAGEHDTPGFWEDFEAFVEAQTTYINQNFGPVWIVFENEPNISRAPDGWNWADWYTYCLQHFYTAVHRASAVTGADNKVIAGNLAGHSADGYRDLYQRGLKNMSDVIGCHPYPDNIRDGVKVEDLARMHEHMEDYGDADKKVLITEGWGSGRSAGFDRSSPLIEPTAAEIENMWYGLAKGWDNLMTPIEHWDPSYLLGLSFFCANDNWGAMNWRSRAIPKYDDHGNITGFIVDGYSMTTDIAPTFWNGGMYDFYGNSKDVLHLLFPGDGLVFMNPGFEVPSEPPDDHTPHFWLPQYPPSTDNYSLDDVIYHGGSRSLKLAQTEASNNGVYQLTAKRSAQAGVAYRARVWCQTEDVDSVRGRFYLRFCNLEGTVKSQKYYAPDVTGDSDWTQMEVTAVSPSFTSRIETGCYIEGVGTVRFDDVTIAMSVLDELGTVKGYTLDEDQVPIAYSVVSTTTGGHQAVSDANGYYEMHDVPSGTYDFICRKPGYVPFRAKNQTVAAARTSFVMFCMGHPKPGLTVTNITADASSVQPGSPINVTVTVENAGEYPVNVGDVGLFMEEGDDDATGKFTIHGNPYNPRVVEAYSSELFYFTVTPRPDAGGAEVSINAYAYAQEDRPNMLTNGAFDNVPWDWHWSFTGCFVPYYDSSDFHSAPRSLRTEINCPDGYTYNWCNNWSAWGSNPAIVAKPNTSYTIGCYHKDNCSVEDVAICVFIQEYYYDGDDYFYNGRKFIGVPHRDAWGHDCLIYLTGDPNVTQGLYSTNRLVASVGPCTVNSTQGTAWWDDVYLKETGNWLADDRADTGSGLLVAMSCASLGEAFAQPEGTVVQVNSVVVTAGAESFADRVYVESPDRACGALVILREGAAPLMGDNVIVAGTVGSVDGEKALLDAVVTVNGGQDQVAVLSSPGLTLAWPITRPLLVKSWGEVKYVAGDSSYFTIDDGSGLTDGAGNPGLKIACDDAVGVTPPSVGDFVTVIGISGCENDGAVPLVRVRSQADIKVE